MIKELLVLFIFVSINQEQLWLHATLQVGDRSMVSENQSDVLFWGKRMESLIYYSLLLDPQLKVWKLCHSS